MPEMTVGLLRELFRNLRAFRALYESDGVDTLQGPGGEWYSLWDLEAVYAQVDRLPPRQQEAIQLCLIENVREVDAAIEMGVSPTNPVAMYATSGLEKLVDLINAGEVYLGGTDSEDTVAERSGPVRMLRTSGRAFCRGCGREFPYDSSTAFIRACREMQAHVCETETAGVAV